MYTRLIAFTSYYFATKAEAVLQAGPWQGQLVATPPALHNMCGLCILTTEEDLMGLLDALHEAHITHTGVYTYNGPTGHSEKIDVRASGS